MASRAQLVAREIRPALERGECVLLDRFFLSTYAYQIAGRGFPRHEVRAANRLRDGWSRARPHAAARPSSGGGARARRQSGRRRTTGWSATGEAFHSAWRGAFDAVRAARMAAAHPECGPIVSIEAGGKRAGRGSRVRAGARGRVGPELSPPSRHLIIDDRRRLARRVLGAGAGCDHGDSCRRGAVERTGVGWLADGAGGRGARTARRNARARACSTRSSRTCGAITWTRSPTRCSTARRCTG